ncbi:CAX interacting protein 1 [Tasmannia lanceolata]|uniref:CAX interacting protein 1 n=1 Tax=Tasmannia lanceolata TaxID=3420 RepID=UPI0040640FF4
MASSVAQPLLSMKALSRFSVPLPTFRFTPSFLSRQYGSPKSVGNVSILPSVQGFRSKPIRLSIRCFSALTPELKSTLDKVVTSHKVLLFMKGTRDFPQCGFSNTVVQILKSLDVPFETMNILENEMLRQGLKNYSNWPTFPQLYIDGEFFGGCDITIEAYKKGELQELLEKAINS